MIVLIGSIRPAKLEGLVDALAAIAAIDGRFRDPEIRAFDVTDVAPRMPMSEAEIVSGARRRAEWVTAAAGPIDEPRFAVGLEGGLDPVPFASPDAGHALYAARTWACVGDGRRWSYGAGGTLVLPSAVSEAVMAGEELGDVVDRLAGQPIRGTRGAWGLLTRDLVTRRDALRTAVISAFAPFISPEFYAAALAGGRADA